MLPLCVWELKILHPNAINVVSFIGQKIMASYVDIVKKWVMQKTCWKKEKHVKDTYKKLLGNYGGCWNNFFGLVEHVVWSKHDIFFGTQMPWKRLLVEMQVLEVDVNW